MPHTVAGVAGGPKYWQYETGGELRPAIERYLRGEELTVRDIYLLQAYLMQWVDSPAWDQNPAATEESRARLSLLRAKTHKARTLQQINDCLKMMDEDGLDPL